MTRQLKEASFTATGRDTIRLEAVTATGEIHGIDLDHDAVEELFHDLQAAVDARSEMEQDHWAYIVTGKRLWRVAQ